LGYRLPLESLPWTKPEDVEYSYDPDPFKTRDKLPDRPARKPYLFTGPPSVVIPEDPADSANGKIPKTGESAAWVSRPALCVQVREGKLYVFMPFGYRGLSRPDQRHRRYGAHLAMTTRLRVRPSLRSTS
jgi:uncharacterized protein (DUF2126 family)